jgi:hypothetical protein
MGIGSGIARRRTTGKTRSSRSILISVFFWTLAAVVLALRRQASAAADTSSSLGAQIAADTGTPPNLIRFGTPLTVIANFVQTDWFGIMFTALLVVCGFVLIQSFRVSMKETSETSTLYPGNEVQGLQAVGEALTLADDETLDPRSRIIRSYEELISAASRLGAAISSDQTARELERNIRTTFLLQGDAIHGLTILFEEARYSLHNITEGDVSKAVKYLQDVSIELNVKLHSEP